MTSDRYTLAEIQLLRRDCELDAAYHRAAALVAAGRVEIITRTHRILEAEVIGSQGERRYIRGDLDGLRCSCPAWHHRHACSHVDAVRLVCAPPGLRRLPPAHHATAPSQTALTNGEQP